MQIQELSSAEPNISEISTTMETVQNNARKNSFKIRGNMSGTTLLKVFFVLFCFVCSKSFTSEYQIFLGRAMERESFEKTR